ncbi:MAG: T9SS type A sorting domain-containing protein [candidate division Zixibacteria bacterium]|nr:T9SS type A sorting domain-containing protein [candidate division Zixibacteria bacterium]
MLKCKKDYYIVLFSLVFILAMAGSSLAVMLPVVNDEVDFEIGSGIVYIKGTAAPVSATDIVEIPFTMDFQEGMDPTGNIEEIFVKIEYNPDSLYFVTARPSSDWNISDPNDYEILVDSTNPPFGIIQFSIEPTSQVYPLDPLNSAPITLAYFDFEAKCQSQVNPNNLDLALFNDGGELVSESYVIANSLKYRPLDDYVTNGTITTKDYFVDFRVKNSSFRGSLGNQISVPITGWSNAPIDGFSLSIQYDQTKLSYAGIENYDTFFEDGFYSDAEYTMPATGANPANICLRTGDGPDALLHDQQFGYEIFYVIFDVVGEWDNTYTTVGFVPYGSDENFFVRIGQENEGYCDELSQSIVNDGSVYLLYNLIAIDDYLAGFESRLLDAENMIWDTPMEAFQTVPMTLKLCNNFNAGPYSWQQNDAITAVVDPPDILTRPYTGFLDQNDDFGAMFSCASDEFSFDTLAIYQYYNTSITHDENAMPISACGHPAEGGVDLVNLNFILNDADITGFTNEEYALDFAPFVLTTGHTTEVKASDYQKTVSLTDGLDTSATPFKVATGEFSSDFKSVTTWEVSQEYYLQSSFDLQSFSITVAVDGYHFVNTVTVDGDKMDYSIAPDYRSVTFTSKAAWIPGVNADRYQFAVIDYDRTVPIIAEHAGPGNITCYWRYYNSTIAFNDVEMNGPDSKQPFLFTAPSNIRRQQWVCYENPIVNPDPLPRDLKSTHASIPEEYMLYQNYPNPFNPDTKFAYDLPEASYVRIEIFNILGQHITTIVDETKPAGSYEVYWNATDDNGQKVSSGIYLYIMQAGNYSRSAKMTLMK